MSEPYTPVHWNPETFDSNTSELHVADLVFRQGETKAVPEEVLVGLERSPAANGKPHILRGPATPGEGRRQPTRQGLHGRRDERLFFGEGLWWVRRGGNKLVFIETPGIVRGEGNRIKVRD